MVQVLAITSRYFFLNDVLLDTTTRMQRLTRFSVCLQGTQMCKLDKADILEMTVSYLKTKQNGRSVPAIGSNLGYLSGFRDCAQETTNYLYEHCGCNLELTSGLYRHLSNASQRLVTSTCDLVSRHQGQTTPTKSGSSEMYMGMHCNSLPGLYQAMSHEQTPFETSWTMLSNTYPYGGNNHGDSKFVLAESEKIADKSFEDCNFVGEISAKSDQSSEDVWRPW